MGGREGVRPPPPSKRESARVEAVLTLIAVAVLANIVLMGAVLSPSLRRWATGEPDEDTPTIGHDAPAPVTGPAPPRRTVVRSLGRDDDRGGPGGRGDRADRWERAGRSDRGRDALALLEPGVPTAAFDRVVRVVAWIFLLSTVVIVSVSGLWRESQTAILVLCAIAGLFVLAVHDLLPADALGAAKFVVEGSVAVTFAALLVLLTGQAESPFFFVFPLIVAGAALVVSTRATLALATAATLSYLVAIGIDATTLSSFDIAVVGINLSALLLLTYVGLVIGREQRHAREEAIRLSSIDPLTGLATRAYFFAALEREISRSTRTGRRFCLLMMDLDELKSINDRHGHFHGDRALRAVSEVIRNAVRRRIDTVARYGGDEFVVLLPETDPTGAWVAAEKIRQAAAEVALEADGTILRTSLSIGVVSHPDDGETPDELMIRADEAMYASKRSGKDRVMGIPIQPDDVVAASAGVLQGGPTGDDRPR